MEFKQMEMDDNKRRRNMILYVLIAFVVYLVLSTVLFPNIGHTQQITKTDYSTFVKALDKKRSSTTRTITPFITPRRARTRTSPIRRPVCRMMRALPIACLSLALRWSRSFPIKTRV